MPSRHAVCSLLLACLVTCGWSVAAAAVPSTYVVQPGDTVFSLARTWGLSVAQVVDLNHLSDTNLRVGQQLILSVPVSSSHVVEAGETLYSLARSVGSTAAQLQAINNLTGTALRVGQLLQLPTPPQPMPAPSPAQAVNRPAAEVPLISAVPSAQTVPGVAAQPDLTAEHVMPLKSLDPPAVPAPQRPALPVGADVTPVGLGGIPNTDWLNRAMALIDVPYRYGGSSPAGTDCSGLVLQIFSPMGLKLPRQSMLQAQVGLAVEQADLQAGDLVFFDTEGRGTVTHDGVYLGDDAFIHANSYNGRVAINRLSEKYYAQRYLTARRVLSQPLGSN